jgi:hypothetical protein
MRASSFLISLLVLGAGLARCGWRPATAADVAADMQTLVGDKHGDVTIRSVEAEGNVLVITLDGPPGWRQAMPSYAMTAYFVDRVCEDRKAARYFEHGRVLRLDSTDAGAHRVHGAPMDHCPRPSTTPISR